ncbi:hypothetical protein FRC03_007034 [Tulasnella sp. 419]|nr:hypothetical protein FRC03_007034 [Tulasnella sp. 419]
MGTTIMGTSCATDSSPSSKFPSRCGTPAIKNIPSHINTISRCDTPTSIQGGITRIAPKRFASPVPSHALPAFLTSAWQYDHETLRANVFSIFIHPPPYYSYDDEEWAVDEEHDSYVDEYEYDSSESSGSSSDRELTPTVGASTIPFPGTDYMDAVPVLDEEQLRRNLEMVQSLPVGNFTHCDGNCDCCKEDYLKVEVSPGLFNVIDNHTDSFG